MYENITKKILYNILKHKIKEKVKKKSKKQSLYKKKVVKNKKKNVLYANELRRIKIYKKYKKVYKKLESLLYFEYYEYYYKKINDDLMLDKDDFNSIKKEKELFYNFDKAQMIIIKILFENRFSQPIFFPLSKDIKKLYKNPNILSKFNLDIKKLEKMFLISNYIRIKDIRIHNLLKNNKINFFKTLPHENIHYNTSNIQTPINILKEYLQILKIIKTVANIIEKISFHKSLLSIYLYRFYQELKWNYIFINKISRNIDKIFLKTLKNTFNTFYLLCKFTKYHYYQKKYKKKKDSIYKKQYIHTILKEHQILNKKEINKNIKFVLINTIRSIYNTLLTSILRENIKITLKNRILFNYMPYVTIISKQYIKTGYKAELSDLIQEGISGVSDAADRFQLGRGVRFLTYAYWWMHNYMMKTTIKKKKIININNNETPKKELLLKIEKLQTEIKKNIKKKDNSLYKFDKIIREETKKLQEIKKKLNRKELILYYLSSGIPPYKIHTLEQLAVLFSVPHTTIQTTLKKIKKKIGFQN
uniref:Sigma-like factor n=1 Tax=Reclinomonas americana ATCC 50284 TaxID=1295595 RepID=M4QM32_RECAM|nr:sigma-like factor [Reclinomonas americana ATCC 50284]